MPDERWPDRTWVTTTELAVLAEVNIKTIYREIKRRHLTATQSGGGRSSLIIDRAEAQRWLAAYKTP